MDSYLAVTCHFVYEDHLASSVLGVKHMKEAHTADNLAAAHTALMEEWGIKEKVKCIVTDGAANMIACMKKRDKGHFICVAHSLNLVVKKALDEIPQLQHIRLRARNVVTYFRASATAKARLDSIQLQMGKSPLKLIIEVDTRWNSTFQMLRRISDLKESVGAALATLKTDVVPLSATEYDVIKNTVEVLEPFHMATEELSTEKAVSASKIIPMMKMLHHTLMQTSQKNLCSYNKQLTESLIRRIRDLSSKTECMSVLTLPTVLDPRYKKLGFSSTSRKTEAITRLKNECAAVIRDSLQQRVPPTTAPAAAPSSRSE